MQGLRLAVVGLGPLGRRVAGDLLARGLGRVVAAIDVSPEIAGRSLADLVPGADPAVRVQASAGEALAGLSSAPDAAVVATSSRLSESLPTLSELLGAGLTVVSTCEELVNPWHRDPAAARALDFLCRERGARLLATGVNPGFLMDHLPLVLTTVCRAVRAVRVERVQDASRRRESFLHKVGAGLDPAEFERRAAERSLGHVGLAESLYLLDRHLGLGVATYEETLEPVRAARDLACAVGAIPRGGIAGVRQVATGRDARGTPVVTLEFVAAVGAEDPRDRIVIEGEPPLEVVIPGGVHGDVATSAIVLNALPRLLEAPPGLHSLMSLPPPHWVLGDAGT